MVSKAYTVKQYKKYEKKWKKELKTLNKQNKMVYSITKKSSSRREINNIKKFWGETSKKGRNSSSIYSSDDLDSNSSISIDGS